MRKLCLGVLCIGILACEAFGQVREEYLDVFVARVKPEKRFEFDTLSVKMANANRKNKGDNYLAYEVIYGEQNVIYYVSARANYAGIDAGMQTFENALMKGLGPAAMGKLFADFNNTVVGTRGEIRRRRLDLSANVPSDPAASNRIVGEARYLRTAIVRVRPGRAPDYEAQLKLNKEAHERGNPGIPILVSQSVVGPGGTTFFITTPVKNFADLDKMKGLPEVRGAQGYAAYLKAVSESVLSNETIIGKFIPAQSNPPEAIAAADPGFWNPKPPPPPPPKKKEAEKK